MFRNQQILYSISLHYAKHILNRNRTMIIHHGLMGSSKNFRTISKHPNVSNYVNSYLIDCRNHGQSPHTQTHTMQDLADDLYDFIKEQQARNNQSNWKKVTLMGHSMGGIALMEFTRKYPEMQEFVDQVIIVDISSRKIDGDPNWNKTKTMLSKMNQIPMSLKKEEIQKKIQEYATTPAIAGLIKMSMESKENGNRWIPNLNILVKNYNEIGNYELYKTEWRKPVDVIYGSISLHVNKKQVNNYLQLYPQMNRQKNFHKIQGAGHWVHFDKPQEFLNAMKVILERGQM